MEIWYTTEYVTKMSKINKKRSPLIERRISPNNLSSVGKKVAAVHFTTAPWELNSARQGYCTNDIVYPRFEDLKNVSVLFCERKGFRALRIGQIAIFFPTEDYSNIW